MSDEALLPEIGPERLNRELEKNIWHQKDHLNLRDLWDYLNRYTYLPRLKKLETLIKVVQAAVGGMLPGPFLRFQARFTDYKVYPRLCSFYAESRECKSYRV